MEGNYNAYWEQVQQHQGQMQMQQQVQVEEDQEEKKEEQEQEQEPPRATKHALVGRICKILVVVTVLVSLAIFVCYSILQPRTFNFQVTEAELIQFDFTNDALQYNLALNFTVKNPNRNLNIYFDKAEGNAFYQGSEFATTMLNAPWFSYLLHTKSTVPMNAVFSGQKLMELDVNEFEQDKRGGSFGIDLEINFDVRIRLGGIVASNMVKKERAKCGVLTPSNVSHGSFTRVGAFNPTNCHVKF